MRKHLPIFFAFVAVALSASTSWATIRFFPDLVAQSPSQRYRVEARSPGNREKQGWVFDSGFTYRCVDTKTGQTLWTRRQTSKKPVGKDRSKLGDFKEGFPDGLYVDDSTWAVIRTGWGNLLGVDPTGIVRWKIDIFSELMSSDDKEKYVVHSSIGPIWTGNAMWYFADVDDTKLFVIRPWWGTRMLVDVQQGEVKKLNEKLAAILLAKERDSALDALSNGLKNRKKWEGGENYKALRPVLRASYLVGKLHVKEAVPCLRELEDVDIRRDSVSSWSEFRPADGTFGEGSWDELTMRQIVHVSLRRLGEKPRPLPCTRLAVYNGLRIRYYETPTLDHPRPEGIVHLTTGMKPAEVLGHIGAPDFVDSDWFHDTAAVGDEFVVRVVWYYDMDPDESFSLALSWDDTGLANIKRHSPPFWQTDKWDKEFAHR